MSRLIAVAVFTALALAVSTASAMQCRNRLVTRGDYPSRVRTLCGEPSDISRRVESRSATIRRRLPNGSVVYESVLVSVEVEVWIYDFGPQRFVRELSFEDGRLRQIRTLGYGTRRSPDPPSTDRPD